MTFSVFFSLLDFKIHTHYTYRRHHVSINKNITITNPPSIYIMKESRHPLIGKLSKSHNPQNILCLSGWQWWCAYNVLRGRTESNGRKDRQLRGTRCVYIYTNHSFWRLVRKSIDIRHVRWTGPETRREELLSC